MCGGVGSRFWPFSRTSMPKQFIDFFGTGESLLQLTVNRVAPIVPLDRIIIVTNAAYTEIVREQLPDIRPENILCEPARRNTAPCVCWAAHHIAAIDPEANILTLPSDHLVLKEEAFRNAVKEGLEFVAGGDRLLTLGLKPASPHTGYGYIQEGKQVEGKENIFHVKSFTEKPNEEMAKFFVESGEFYWNSGIFLWSAKSILNAFSRYAPEMATLFDQGRDAYGTPQETEFINVAFPSAANISIDYAIMEKTSNVFVETVDLGWSDLGSWKALYDISPKNQDMNVTQNCKILANDTKGSVFAVSGDKIVAVEGLHDFIVADTPAALLICPLKSEQKIRHIVNEIRSRFGEDYI